MAVYKKLSFTTNPSNTFTTLLAWYKIDISIFVHDRIAVFVAPPYTPKWEAGT